MEKEAKIYISGHSGLLGSALVRCLKKIGYTNLLVKTSEEIDLRNQREVESFFEKEKPDYVIHAAARVGGIKANMEKPAQFIYDNIQMETNVINSAWKYGVKKLLFISSNCIYPKDAKQPFQEDSLGTGKIESTNEAYGMAKLAGMAMCKAYNTQYKTNFISVIPCSLFGPGDNFDPEGSHLIPALIRKFYEAKINNLSEAVLWGTGTPRREIMYVDDAAEACIFLMNNYNSSEPINAGIGKDYSIKEIAEMIKEIIGFKGKMVQDISKPDGINKKLIDSSKIYSLGWKPNIDIIEGLKKTFNWYKDSFDNNKELSHV
ncbi:MAG: GDP-L-fucose synthase [Nanoarchaeota archaeon]|nr:GDP-L-fucose synthase [Nanoarchaeota archaeon]